jgi:hypothetical protein
MNGDRAQRIELIEGVKGIAILLVVAAHLVKCGTLDVPTG